MAGDCEVPKLSKNSKMLWMPGAEDLQSKNPFLSKENIPYFIRSNAFLKGERVSTRGEKHRRATFQIQLDSESRRHFGAPDTRDS
jgi:hypothetical protein